jgi:tRNA threonylcarbamoyladenosine biosynthesis protein TsaB
MNLLALDTATESLSVCLEIEGQRWSRDGLVRQQHAELALPWIEALLAEAGATFAQIEGIAVSIGPGAFTGLRIGCGMVQGLAFGLGIPVVGVNTLEALAADTPGERILATLDARMGEVYLAAFERQSERLQPILPAGVYRPDALPTLEGEWVGVGSGLQAHPKALAQTYRFAHTEPGRFPHAVGVLKVARPRFLAGEAVAADRLELLYLRDKVALTSAEQAQARRA